MPVSRNMRALAFEEASVMLAAGRYVQPATFAKGWFVWESKGQRYVHNPFHGEGPSGRDHQFTASDEEKAGRWFEVHIRDEQS